MWRTHENGIWNCDENNSSSGGNFVRGSIYLNDSFTEKCWLQYISSGIE